MGVADDIDPFADVAEPERSNVVALRDEPPAYMDAERGSTPPVSFRATPFTWRDPRLIPRREFLYGFELRRGQVSAVVAPGAAGKTTFKVGRALCMATGQERFGHRVWNGPHRVWLWNLEDEMEEVEKTIHAFAKLWDLSPTDYGDRLFIDGIDNPGTQHLKLAVEDKARGFTVQRPVSEAVIAELVDRKIDYIDIDPFISSHSVDENSNPAIDAVAKEWVRIAHVARCAVGLALHTSKGDGELTAKRARGASSVIDAARSALVFQGMSKEDAQGMRIAECDRKRFFSVYDDKNNKAPAAAGAEWYQFVGVGLGNGDETGPEDNIGALQRWTPPNTFAGVTAYQLFRIQEFVASDPDKARYHSSATYWVGKMVARVLDRDVLDKGEAAAIKRMVDTWISTGALRKVERPDYKREPKEFVEVGQLVEYAK